jgi:hypothetical protein
MSRISLFSIRVMIIEVGLRILFESRHTKEHVLMYKSSNSLFPIICDGEKAIECFWFMVVFTNHLITNHLKSLVTFRSPIAAAKSSSVS